MWVARKKQDDSEANASESLENLEEIYDFAEMFYRCFSKYWDKSIWSVLKYFPKFEKYISKKISIILMKEFP